MILPFVQDWVGQLVSTAHGVSWGTLGVDEPFLRQLVHTSGKLVLVVTCEFGCIRHSVLAQLEFLGFCCQLGSQESSTWPQHRANLGSP